MSFDDFDTTDPVGEDDLPIYDRDLPKHWHDWASAKGYEIVERVIDKNHLLLRCCACGGRMISKVFVLRTGTPRCPHCLEDRRRELCDAAGVTFLAPARPHYFRIQLPCGHEAERQQEFLERVRAGQTEIRCEECLEARLRVEAEARGWSVVCADPAGHKDYLLYRHSCGHEQRVAIINMRTGRFTCGGCSDAWTRAPSYLYAMRFGLMNGRIAVKVGFSRDPGSRLRHQLVIDLDQDAELIRVIPVGTGHDAICREKRLHVTLRRHFPDAVLDRSEFEDEVRVLSELYCASIEPEIMALLDDIELRVRSLAKRGAKLARRSARQEARRARNRQRRKRTGGPVRAGCQEAPRHRPSKSSGGPDDQA